VLHYSENCIGGEGSAADGLCEQEIAAFLTFRLVLIFPRSLCLKQPRQTWVAGGWLVEHLHKALERYIGKGKVAAIEQNVFGFPTRRVQNEIGAIVAERLRGAVDQILLPATNSQVDALASGSPVSDGLFAMGFPSFVNTTVYMSIDTSLI
jgi:hypothetical protein